MKDVKDILIELGDLLDATDEVEEVNYIGFNKPDKMSWRYVRGDENAMKAMLLKYKKQLISRIGSEVENIDWNLPKNADSILKEAKRKGKQEYWAGTKKEMRYGVPTIELTEVEEGMESVLKTDARIPRDIFDKYLSAHRKWGGRYNGKGWVMPYNTDFNAFRAELTEIGMNVGEMPVIDPAKIKAAGFQIKVKKIANDMIGIFHPFSNRMNQAYRDAEETSGIIGWNPELKCRMVHFDDYADLKEVLETLSKHHPEWKMQSEFDLNEYYKSHAESRKSFRMITDEISAVFRPEITPFPHQIEGIKYLNDLDGNALVGDDMGMGKTMQVLAYAAMNDRKLFVVVPKNVRRQWLQEADKFFNEGLFRGFELDEKTPTDIDLSGYNLVTLNYELLHKFRDVLMKAGFDTMVLDESHRVKNPNAKITKTAREMAPEFKHHILMSGTPLKNKKKELYTQTEIVSPGLFKNMSEITWMTYFECRTRLRKIFFRRTKKQEIDLPPKIRTVIDREIKGLPDYEEGMQVGDISALKSQLAIAKTPMTIEFVKEILNDSDSKVIVYSDSDKAANIIAEAFGSKAVIHVGSTKHEDRETAKAKFCDENSEVRVFVATTGSAREGLNLTIADKEVFNDLPWTSADLNQAEDRAHRIGQENCLNVYWMRAVGNVFDMRVIDTLMKKADIYKKVIEGKKPTEAEKEFLEQSMKRFLEETQKEVA